LRDGAVKNGSPPNLPWQHDSFDSYVSIEFRDSIPLRYMKPVTVVLGLAAIIGTGTLTKIAEAIELVAAIQTGLAANPKLVEWIEQELNQKQSQLATIENWKGINIKGGINTITGNTLNF
jgi:hypothetical protein